ncbi:hypothetical protein CASFOL_014539 [Castilleja foliolosa]|uniref:Uncharacterized protein n=1 Tax=Castilleja foliolosa TaxID=1961234 RepID=A0ABD3DPD1_9LAMI
MQGQGDIEHHCVMGNDDGGDIYGNGDRHGNYTKSNIDGNADSDSNDIDMDSDSDVNTDSDVDPEVDGNVEHGGVEVRPEIVSILPPCPVKTKGSGASGRRLKSLKEQAIDKSNKPLRLCRKCNQKTTHDSRNCDKIKGVVNL